MDTTKSKFFSLRIDDETAQAADKKAKALGFKNRSQYLAALLRKDLEEASATTIELLIELNGKMSALQNEFDRAFAFSYETHRVPSKFEMLEFKLSNIGLSLATTAQAKKEMVKYANKLNQMKQRHRQNSWPPPLNPAPELDEGSESPEEPELSSGDQKA